MSAQERSRGASRESAASSSENDKASAASGGGGAGGPAEVSPAVADARAAAPPSFSATVSADPELQRIRDILFGEQVRLFERRMSELEERAAREIAILKQEQQARLSAIETRIKTEAESMGRRLEIERTRIDALNQLAASLREEILAERRDRVDAVEKLVRRVDEVADEQPPRFAELQERLNRCELKDEDLARGIASADQALRQLGEKKMDRSAFAALLGEMTAGLTGGGAAPPKTSGSND